MAKLAKIEGEQWATALVYVLFTALGVQLFFLIIS